MGLAMAVKFEFTSAYALTYENKDIRQAPLL